MSYFAPSYIFRANYTKTMRRTLMCLLLATFSTYSFADHIAETAIGATKGTTIMDSKTQLDVALLHLAARMSISTDEITVVKHEKVMWPSSAYGCPKPGEMYSQALVPGTRILLQVGRQTFHYHASLNGTPFHCPAHRLQNIQTDFSES